MPSPRTLACSFFLATSACDAATPDTEDDSKGAQIYRTRVDDGNTFTCATCHAIDEPATDFRRPGHPLGNAAARPHFKNGGVSELRDAVNSCLQEWMNAEPWSADDLRWLELERFLAAEAPASSPAIDIRIVQPPEDLGGGDAARGREVFDATCAVCHDIGGSGTNLAPAVAGLGLDPGYVATRVRTSGRSDSAVYDGLTGGVMPFWGADRLSDSELRDIVAWLAVDDGNASEVPDPEPDPTGGDETGDDIPSNCPATHERVGWVAELQEDFHGVGGTAEIVDDCTVVIHDFTYDGAGIDVRIYGGIDGDYDNGFAMTEDLLLPGGYNGVLLEAVLPEGVTLDSLDGISVWCVDVGVDFGNGAFAPP